MNMRLGRCLELILQHPPKKPSTREHSCNLSTGEGAETGGSQDSLANQSIQLANYRFNGTLFQKKETNRRILD